MLQRNTWLRDALPWLLGALGAVSAIATIFGISREVAIPLFLVVLLLLSIYGWMRRRPAETPPLPPPQKSTSKSYAVKATHRDDVFRVWEFENTVYGQDNISVDTLRRWWSRYQKAAFFLEDRDGRVAGTFAMYPLGKEPFRSLLAGDRLESDLTDRSIRRPNPTEVVPYWYLPTITLRNNLRNGAALPAFLAGIADRLMQLPDFGIPTEICAFGYSRNGEQLLDYFGFKLYKPGTETKYRKPTYILTLETQSQLDALHDRITRLQRSTRNQRPRTSPGPVLP